MRKWSMQVQVLSCPLRILPLIKENKITKKYINCLCCGKQTTNPKYCSRSCAAKVSNKANPKRKLVRKCVKCDKVVANHKTRYCEEHDAEPRPISRHEVTIGEYRNAIALKGRHPSWMHANVRFLARQWFKEMKKLPCAKCGYDKHVELAHIKSLSSFPDDTKLSEVNSESNLIQLCRNCHWEFDNLPLDSEFIDLLHSLNKNIKH